MTDTAKNEADTSPDEVTARSRATGGVPDPTQPDQNSTTGTTPNEEFVGRVAGVDVGAGEETGAERRAQAAKQAGSVDEAQSAADLNPEIEARLHNG